MEGEDEGSEDPRAFTNKAPWQKFIILVAGSFMNYLLGVILLMIVFSHSAGFTHPVIASFMEGCPYESVAGLQEGTALSVLMGTESDSPGTSRIVSAAAANTTSS